VFLTAEGPLQQALSCGVHHQDTVLMAGDLNCALTGADVLGGQEAAGNRAVGASALADLLASRGMLDAWGALHGATGQVVASQ
jgi:hypothetical protein